MTGAASSAAERAALAALDEDFMLRALREMVAVPSLPAREQPAQDLMARLLAEAGARVEQFDLDVDALRAHPSYSTEHPRAAPTGVRGQVGDGDGGRCLVLNGHTDVVPVGNVDDWKHDPFDPVLVGRRLYGRGACDMKGGLAAGLAAVKAIIDADIALSGRVVLDAVVGEEDGGCGTLGSLLHGMAADAAVVMEPTRLAVSPAVAGALTFSIMVRGKAAHGCLREEGVSAVEKLPFVHAALLDLEHRRNSRRAEPLFDWLERPFAICVGRLEAGDWASSEADWLRMEGRYGVAPDESLDDARAELEAAVSVAAGKDPWLADHPPKVAWVGAQFLPGRTDSAAAVVGSLIDAVRDTAGHPPKVHGQPYGCDMGLLTRVGGIPTVVFGPGDIRQAHAVDEWVDIDEVASCARALTVAAIRFTSAGCDSAGQ